MSFITDCESQLALFVSVHNRQPANGKEFAEWCEHIENNSTTLNSRRDIKTFAKHQPIVQGAGHVIFADGTKCARYEDSEGIYYFRPDLYTEEFMVSVHGEYKMN